LINRINKNNRINTNALFSSEIGKFDSRDFGIYAEMNDYLGDYREFDI
jgi:hypothetical protein